MIFRKNGLCNSKQMCSTEKIENFKMFVFMIVNRPPIGAQGLGDVGSFVMLN